MFEKAKDSLAVAVDLCALTRTWVHDLNVSVCREWRQADRSVGVHGEGSVLPCKGSLEATICTRCSYEEDVKVE